MIFVLDCGIILEKYEGKGGDFIPNYQYKRIKSEDFAVMPMCILKDDYKNGKRTSVISVNNVISPNRKHLLNSMDCILSKGYPFSQYHFHEGIEILRINCGCANVIINDKSYAVTKNDILIVNPFENHGIYLLDKNTDITRECIIFQPSDLFPPEKGNNKLLLNELRNLRFRNFIPHTELCNKELCTYIDNIMSLSEQRSIEWPIAIFSNLIMFYAVLIRENFQTKEEFFIPYQYEFMTNVSVFIEQNLSRQITTEEISRYFGYSTEHFCRLFKKCFNRPFKEYLNICRIEKAKEMMDGESRGTLTEIWKAAGFGNANHFSNIFKKCIGICPSAYLKTKRKSIKEEINNEISTV